MYGWQGTVLVVDLTEHRITKNSLDPEVAQQFLGGRGLNSKTLFDLVKPGIDPLGRKMSYAWPTAPCRRLPWD